MLEEGLSHSRLLMLACIKQVQDAMFPWEEVTIDSLKQNEQNQPQMHPAQVGQVEAELSEALLVLRDCCRSSGCNFVIVLQAEIQSKMCI